MCGTFYHSFVQARPGWPLRFLQRRWFRGSEIIIQRLYTLRPLFPTINTLLAAMDVSKELQEYAEKQ
jgi:hypothetical protein